MTRKMKIQKPDDKYFGYTQLFRYATWLELTATWFGFIMGVITSFGLPLSLIIYGEYTQLMVERSIPGGEVSKTILMKFFGAGVYIINATAEENADLLAADAKAFGLAALVIAGLQFLAGVFSIQSLNWSAQRQILRIRLLFLKSVLRQDMSWYDTQPNLNFASKITDDLNKLKEGIGEKIGMFCYLMFSFILSMLMSFTYGWKLTMVIIVSAPLIIISAALLGKAQSSLTVKELNSYCYAGTAAEEVLSAIRTVVAFGGEEKEIQRYRERLEPANKAAIHRGLVTGLGGGVMWLIMYWTFALVFWYGVQLIQIDKVLPLDDRTYTPGVLVIVLWGIIGGAQNLGICTPHAEAFAAARGAAQSLFDLIGRIPAIDSLSEDGETPEKILGDIKLDDVTFRYPSRPDVKVLTGLTLEIKAGETVALLGVSGCGKSTILQLVQRLYDPLSGKIELDGRNVSSLNVAWLRSQLGVVGQEPVLFSGTIRDNIAQGKPECSDTEIKEAATAANCHEFIRKLPFGYKTIIGERGTQLSGGQKQRIAIARSLIRNPKILLLDEATSALDARGERRVQDALDKASTGRTTLIVTHRLVTIRSASRIVFIDEGRIVEQGTHAELMALKGNYFKLVRADSCNDNHPGKTKSRTDEDFDVVTEDSETNGVAVIANSSGETTPRQVKQISNENLRSAQRRFSVSSVASFGRTNGIQSFYETQSVNDDNTESEELKTSVSNWDLLKLNKPEWIYILFGTISALIVGGVLPIFALLFSGIYGLLSMTDADEISSGTELYCLLFFVIGIVCGAGSFLQSYLFTQAGVKLTQRLRVSTFANFLKQEIGWFDDQKNSVGALCTRLSGDAAAVQGATGVRVGTIFQGASTLLVGIIMALLYSWKMTLVSLITIPIVLGGMYLESLVTQTSQLQERKALEGASKIATEAIMNIRTVHSMGSELLFLKRYEQELKEASKAGGVRSRFRGTVYSIGICSPTFGYGLSLFYGGLLIAYEGLPYRNALLVTEALLFGSWMLGQILAFAPNFNGAKVSGARIVQLLNRQSLIKSNEKITDDPSWTADGTIKYSDVDFRYPSRQNVEVLQGLDFEVLPGKTVALVGHSGCGKSTAVQLLQRLYEPSRGIVALDGKNVSTDLKIPRLRCQLGLVSQEPTLFDRTIAENIAYGDNTRDVPIDEIIQAAIKSNIHGFISGLPLGYETPLGTNGAQLSGGQKQRVAIARALVRNPRVLLLDEATSALDSQSEKLVQQALDVAKEGRTCITIAHRLSTIQKSDLICVIDKGRVMEKGSHSELMAMKGVYADLQTMQGTATDAVSSRQNTIM